MLTGSKFRSMIILINFTMSDFSEAAPTESVALLDSFLLGFCRPVSEWRSTLLNRPPDLAGREQESMFHRSHLRRLREIPSGVIDNRNGLRKVVLPALVQGTGVP